MAFVGLGKLWILGRPAAGGGGGDSGLALWSTSDGRTWELSCPRVPWKFPCETAIAEFGGRLWALCGSWKKQGPERGTPASEVWSSPTGADWQLASATVPWGEIVPESGVVFANRLWIAETERSYGWHVRTLGSSADGLQWVAASPPPWAWRFGFGAAVHGGALWILGGRRQVSRDEWYLLGDVWCSPDGVRWIEVSRLAPWGRRAGMAAVSFGDRLWILGGYDDRPVKQRLQDEVWMLDVPDSHRKWLGMEPGPD